MQLRTVIWDTVAMEGEFVPTNVCVGSQFLGFLAFVSTRERKFQSTNAHTESNQYTWPHPTQRPAHMYASMYACSYTSKQVCVFAGMQMHKCT